MNLRAEINQPKLWIDIKVQTPEGVTLQELSEEGHSWVRNFYMLYSMLMLDTKGEGGGFYLQQTNGNTMLGIDNTYSGYTSQGYYGYWHGVGGAGIVLGTSNEPFHIADYSLYGGIGHGNGAGQLYRQSISRSIIYNNVNESIQTKFIRVFNNNSNGTIVIREVGLYGIFETTTLLMARDVLSVPITVPHGTLITVTYTLTTTSLSYLRPLPAIGTKGMGGYYAGQIWGSASVHKKYGFIVAPIAGEGTASCQTSAVATGITNDYTGIDNTQSYLAMGASSPMGVFCNNIRNASPAVGGYSDWYIPSYAEMQYFFPRVRDLLSPVDAFTNTNYLSSTENGSTWAISQKGGNPVTSTWTVVLDKTTAYRVRLIRRILVDDFIPDVVTP